jgi:prolipoprotein diacylglyceryltransferase
LIYLAKRNSTKGKITSAYLIGYGAIRLVLEPLRPTDSVWRIFNVPTAQVVAVMVIIVGMVLYKKTQPLED